MLPEWGRFVTTIKFNRGLKESNHDQLYAYLKQHEVHANENKMLLERLNQHSNNPLTLMSNVSSYQYSPSSSVPPQPLYIPPVTYQLQFADNTLLNTGLSLADELLDSLSKQGKQNMVQGNNGRGDVAAGNRGAQNRDSNANAGQGKPIKCYNYNGIGHIARNCNQPKRSQNSDYFKEKMLLMQAQENGVDLDEEQLLFLAGGQTNTFDDDVDEGPVQDMAQNEYNIFQADQCDAFDSDVDEAPTAHTMFMANLSLADLVYDEVGPSYDFDILSEVQDHDNYLDIMNEYHEEHEMQNDVQPNEVIDSYTEYTSNSNIISFEQYVQNNEAQVIQSDVSSVLNDALMMIINDIDEQPSQYVPTNKQNKVVNESLIAKLARYKELAEVYKKGPNLN
ncbi:retrovirus-related pol polyprotein from transposon TNT 1-94 [Tanacetum coccineum]